MSTLQDSTDRGLLAWSQVLVSWLLFANTWGLTNSFGVFQTYYSKTLLPGTDQSKIAWIGSVQTFLTMFVGAFASLFLASGRVRLLMVIGSALEVIGLAMTSLGHHYWQLLLSQGVCTGLGSGLLAITSLAILPPYFKRRRMLSGGIAATGSSFAGIIYPIMVRELITRVGFKWAVLVLTLTVASTLLFAIILVRPKYSDDTDISLPNDTFKDPRYIMVVMGFTFTVAAIFVPYFYVQDYSIAMGTSEERSFYILSIMNASSLVGRLLPNYLADRFGGINVMIPCNLAAIVLFFCWDLGKTVPTLIVVGSVYTFVAGGMISVIPLTITEFSESHRQSSTRMGVAYTVASLGALVGSPIAGLFKADRSGSSSKTQNAQHEFRGVWYFAGVAITIATMSLLIARHLAVGFRFRQKI